MVHLFVNPYRHPSPERNAELIEALRRNRDCRWIGKIHEITEPARPTIREMLAVMRWRVGWADIGILANSDIYFDDTLKLVDCIGYQECFALARYDGEQSEEICFYPHGQQDTWIFRGPPPDVAADFPLGVVGVDSRLGQLLRDAGYSVYNPSHEIKTHHLHASAIRPANREAQKITGQYAYIPPCRLEHIRHRPTDRIDRPGRIAIVQLGPWGDIVQTLPIAQDLCRKGNQIFWFVQREFAAALEGVSYVTPVIWEGPADLPGPAIEEAGRLGCERVLALQVRGNPEPAGQKTENYSTEIWARAEYLDKFHVLPCVFDRAQLPAAGWKPKGEKPILAYCLASEDSSYPAEFKREMEGWLRGNFGAEYSLLDLDGLKWRPDSLAAGLREAAVLVSVEAYPLQVGYAAGTPAIAITRTGRHASEPRRNWIERVNDAQSMTPEGQEKIAGALRAVLAGKIEPGRLIAQPGNLPMPLFSQIRSLSILIATQAAHERYLKVLKDHLVPQLNGNEEVEILCRIDRGEMPVWETRNELLKLAHSAYCCFVDVGDDVAENFISLIVRELRSWPDCVGFKVGRVASGKVQSVERYTSRAENAVSGAAAGETVCGIAHYCPVRTEIARMIGFGPGGDAEYARKLAESGLLVVENFVDEVIYAKGFSSLT